MKVKVSSKELATKLSRIDFSENVVRSVSFIKIKTLSDAVNIYEMKLNLKDSYQTVIVEINDNKNFKDFIIQKYNRWDLLRNLTMSINDKPITLEIKTGILNVVLNF
jgi:hypothetical protein